MSRQSCIGCIDELHQLRTGAFEVKPASHELQLAQLACNGPLAERIEINVGNVALLGGHRNLHPSANDGVEVFYANAV